MSNKLKSFLILILIFGSAFFIVSPSLAAVDTGLNAVGNSIALGNVSPIKTVTNVINVLMGLLSLIAICLILWGGFTWMTSNGSEDKIDTAKKILKNSVIGLVIILSAWGITFFILTKLVDATGGGSNNGGGSCTHDESCGCGGAQSCINGKLGSCQGSTCNPIIDKTICDGNAITAQCEADNNLCGTDFTCDATSCLCKPKASLGDSCNATPTGGKCTADDNLCGPYLKCDTNSCICYGPPVITGISPVGGHCANDENRACNLDSDCLGGAKCDTSTPNGTTNNFLTIYGYNFGTSSASEVPNTGEIVFMGGNTSQAKVANSPKLLNPSCINSWTDKQVIIAVPGEVVTGPIEVKRESNSDNNTDTTNDNNGPKIADFVKNNISRPGLCQISPTQGLLGDTVGYQGINLRNSTAYFGEYTSAYKGINSTFSEDNLSGQTLAPSIVPGQTTTFVAKTTTGVTQKSNALMFIKEREAAAGPYISSFYPAAGPAGQYVTILGGGFGNLRGSRQVLFGDTPASYAFPDVCSNAVWSDSQVIVKVPNGLTAGDYKIQMNLGSVTINSDLLSPKNTFKFNPAETLKTSLCKIDPERGQIGDKVSLWGEYFGTKGTDALVVFNRGIATSSKITKDGTADKIETVVPISDASVPAITGPVHVMKNGESGNELNFTVGKCASDSECNASSPVCCPNNTYKTGSCEASLLSCYFEVPNSVFETKFNTTLTGTDPNTNFDSCIGMAAFYGTCQTGQFCPNSPGKCSPFTPTQAIAIGDCGSKTSACGAIDYCKTNPANCTYSTINNKDLCQGKKCQLEKDINYSLSPVPRVSFWPGKVNQHFDLTLGTWFTDSDGSSGSGVNSLTYCQKFYPTTESVIPYKNEIITSWKAGGNTGNYTAIKKSYRCVLKGENITEEEKYKGSLSCRAYIDKITNKSYLIKQLKVSTSCPSGFLNTGGGYCVDISALPVTSGVACKNNQLSIGDSCLDISAALCEPCPTGFKCNEDANTTDDLGICESAKICATGASCGINPTDPTKFSCLKADQAKCDCCCEIGQDTRDCCAGLKCAGTCGSDTTDNGAGYGSCSGCDIKGATVQQKDAACNCSTSSGKICDTSKAGGVCTDCAALDETGCSAHSAQCCFDATKNVCQGGDGTLLGGKCAYYDCDATNKTTCNQTATTTGQFLATSTCVDTCPKTSKTACDLAGSDPVACSLLGSCCFDAKNKKCTNGTDTINLLGVNYCSYYNCITFTPYKSLPVQTCNGTASTTGQVLGLDACNKNCKPNITSPGLTCASEAIGTCDTSFCGDPYKCLAVSGSGPSASECGTCCCNPGDKNGDLTCLANQGNCDGSSRGLFCGCTSDNQCGNSAQGCGKDTCCHGRPAVTNTSPKNNDQNVCRNRQIEVDFNQQMNVTNLASNILLVEEKTYGTDVCPNGSTLSFSNFKPKTTNFLARLFQAVTNNFKHLFSGAAGNTAIAAMPSPDKLYCVAPITVESESSYTNGATSTKIYIQPQKILSASTNYFVVVKGDENLDSNSGVMSLDKVGLSGSATSNSNHINNPAFNGVTFKNSYTFSFTTMSDNSGKNGICTINEVVVNPVSFLINNADNDTSDDNPANDTFDTKNDSDRAVSALAYSSDKQLLQPVTGYNWKWFWKIDDDSVVTNLTISGLKSNQIVVRAVSGVTDKSTKIGAVVNMAGFSNITNVGDGLSGASDVYVFLCANPWPAANNGIWNPWSDASLCKNSLGDTFTCNNYNYKFYYCRDAGGPGTADDLPAVANPALILGSSAGDLICSTDGTSCNAQGATCGTKGTCIWNVLKESYFFREAIPQAGEITKINSTGAGGQIFLSWDSPVSTIAPVTLFKIYYGLANGKSSSYITSLSLTEANCNISNNANHCSYNINNLVDGSSYYFKVSSLTDKKAESPLSGGATATSTDITAPAAPSWYSIPRVMFWSSKVNQHFDITKGVWATDSDGKSGAGVNQLQYCKKFYPTAVSVQAYMLETISTWKASDISGDTRNFTNTLMSYRCVLSPAVAPISASNGKLNINWAVNSDDTLYYRLFHGILPGKKASDSVDSPNNTTNLSFDLSNYRVGDHYFYLAAIDKSGNVSATSDEIKINIPAAPTNLIISQPSNNTLAISWSNYAGIPSYSLFADPDSDVKTLIATSSNSAYYWSRTSVINGVLKTNYSDGDYYFAVSVKNDQGFESAKSEVVNKNIITTK